MYYFYRDVPKRKNKTKFDQKDEQMNNGLLPLDVRKTFACQQDIKVKLPNCLEKD